MNLNMTGRRKTIAFCLTISCFSFCVVQIGAFIFCSYSAKTQTPLVVNATIPAGADYYLGYSSGGVDHYELFHNLDATIDNAREAEVIFLGNSRAKYTFLRDNLAPYFAEKKMKYYVMGFGYGEGAQFPWAIIKKYNLKPKWVVVATDSDFFPHLSEFSSSVLKSTIFDAYKFKFETVISFWFRRVLHSLEPYFDISPKQTDWIEFRSSKDGTILVGAYKGEKSTVSLKISNAGVNELLDNTSLFQTPVAFKQYFEKIGAKLIITCIPPSNCDYAAGVAQKLKIPFVVPNTTEFETMDGSHLTTASSKVFVSEFLAKFDAIAFSKSD